MIVGKMTNTSDGNTRLGEAFRAKNVSALMERRPPIRVAKLPVFAGMSPVNDRGIGLQDKTRHNHSAYGPFQIKKGSTPAGCRVDPKN